MSPDKNREVELCQIDQKETEDKNDEEDVDGGGATCISQDPINESEAKISNLSESSSSENISSESSSSESSISETSSSSEEETSEGEAKWGTDNEVEQNIDQDEEMDTVPYLDMTERDDWAVPVNKDYEQKYEHDITMNDEEGNQEIIEIEGKNNNEISPRKEEVTDMTLPTQQALCCDWTQEARLRPLSRLCAARRTMPHLVVGRCAPRRRTMVGRMVSVWA